MDFKKITDQLILLLLCALASFGIAIGVRLVVIKAGEDAGTANLVFIGVLAVCAVGYMIIRSVLEKNIIPLPLKKLGFKERPTATNERPEPQMAKEPAQAT